MSFYKQNHPYKYYKNSSRGPDQYIKRSFSKPSEVRENDPIYYQQIAEAAKREGTHIESLETEAVNRLASEVCERRSTLVLKTGDHKNVTSQASETSSDPRSPIKDPTMSTLVDPHWLPHY